MQARGTVGICDGQILCPAIQLVFAAYCEQGDIGRQTVCGKIAMSGIDRHRHLDAGSYGQIAIQGGKGQRGRKVGQGTISW